MVAVWPVSMTLKAWQTAGGGGCIPPPGRWLVGPAAVCADYDLGEWVSLVICGLAAGTSSRYNSSLYLPKHSGDGSGNSRDKSN